jgi:hypothetical protein
MCDLYACDHHGNNRIFLRSTTTDIDGYFHVACWSILPTTVTESVYTFVSWKHYIAFMTSTPTPFCLYVLKTKSAVVTRSFTFEKELVKKEWLTKKNISRIRYSATL